MLPIDNQPSNKNLSDQVMSLIKSDRILMRPKWKFILEAALGGVGTILVLLTLVYFVSFIVFILRQSGAWFVPIFGARGWWEFLFALPWLLITLALVCFIILEILVRRYSFAYRWPFSYSLLGVIILAAVGGIWLAHTSLHQNLWRNASTNHLSAPAGGWYRQFGRPHPPNIERGVIAELFDNGLYIQAEAATDLIKVIIDSRTRWPQMIDFKIGDMVVVMGKKEKAEIRALGVMVVNDEFDWLPPIDPPGRGGHRFSPPFRGLK